MLRPKKIELRCESCQQPFRASRYDARFCSPACRRNLLGYLRSRERLARYESEDGESGWPDRIMTTPND